MNIAELQKKLLAAARANPPGDRVPYAFEKRVMALLAARNRSSGVVDARALAGSRVVRGNRLAARRMGIFQSNGFDKCRRSFPEF